MGNTMSDAIFFTSRAEWRRWLEENHARATEQWIGFHKVGAEKTGITYAEALDEALCFGWIDGIRRGDHTTWSIRFGPRRTDSVWSAVNMARIEELIAARRVTPAGLAAYQSRNPENRAAYSYEMSAKQEATRERRLATLIADSAAGRKIKPLRRPGE
jgi:uncharacterized protein YdeI (YjbR/CyaY-like superfamily)